ncbi:MAG: type II toxin-antitoxin system Phd/YefM family antitoxin [Magnetococcales bacterium]|nr:type II toxin-antitoxin system Phd/YefM family antitoxin [Magnetococcales bacterium]
MQIINMQEARKHFSRFVDQAASGEEILIARSGRPIARLVPLALPEKTPRKLGIGQGRFTMPENFSTLHNDEIQHMFETGK